ncbi:MAG: Bacterial alpha-L-rhamnosidase [Candidatus Hydrogenedentes bacterium ADurb.Bin179]|nr:MAG: Bacterial alpha-L-rhamnosidase [Candidatus Hydrogenedentes bacterium ADurb.Bin179]
MYMVERTGTLWENQQDHASLNHGFASHAVVTLFRDVLGVAPLDVAQKNVTVTFNPTSLAWCSGEIPVGDAHITVQWKQEDKEIQLFATVPEDYTIQVENRTDKTVKRVDNLLFNESVPK